MVKYTYFFLLCSIIINTDQQLANCLTFPTIINPLSWYWSPVGFKQNTNFSDPINVSRYLQLIQSFFPKSLSKNITTRLGGVNVNSTVDSNILFKPLPIPLVPINKIKQTTALDDNNEWKEVHPTEEPNSQTLLMTTTGLNNEDSFETGSTQSPIQLSLTTTTKESLLSSNQNGLILNLLETSTTNDLQNSNQMEVLSEHPISLVTTTEFDPIINMSHSNLIEENVDDMKLINLKQLVVMTKLEQRTEVPNIKMAPTNKNNVQESDIYLTTVSSNIVTDSQKFNEGIIDNKKNDEFIKIDNLLEKDTVKPLESRTLLNTDDENNFIQNLHDTYYSNAAIFDELMKRYPFERTEREMNHIDHENQQFANIGIDNRFFIRRDIPNDP